MIYYILIGIAALYALYASFSIKKLSARTITIIQVIAIAMTLTGVDSLITYGMYLYGISLLSIILYGLTAQGFSRVKRSVLTFPVLLIFLAHSFRILHLPGAGWLSLSMIIPIIIFVFILVKKRPEYKNEIGFTVVMLTDALIKLMAQIDRTFI